MWRLYLGKLSRFLPLRFISVSFNNLLLLKAISTFCQYRNTKCQIRIKSEPFFVDLKFKSEHLKSRQSFVIGAIDVSSMFSEPSNRI